MARGFQRGAFQRRAFQQDEDVAVADPGSSIAAGTFSRGQWRDLLSEIEAEHAALRKRRDEQRRQREAERERIAAEIAAETARLRAAEDADLARRLRAMQGTAPKLDMAAIHAAAQRAAAVTAAMHAHRAAQDDDEEALALLLAA